MSDDGEYRPLNAEETRLYREIAAVADGYSAATVIGVALALLTDIWRDHPEVHKADEFVRICSDQLRRSLDVSPAGRRH